MTDRHEALLAALNAEGHLAGAWHQVQRRDGAVAVVIERGAVRVAVYAVPDRPARTARLRQVMRDPATGRRSAVRVTHEFPAAPGSGYRLELARGGAAAAECAVPDAETAVRQAAIWLGE